MDEQQSDPDDNPPEPVPAMEPLAPDEPAPAAPEPGPPKRKAVIPLWLRLLTITMVAVMAVGVIHTVDYMRARRELNRAIELSAAGGAGAIAKAHAAAQRAYDLLPSNKTVRSFWHYFAGLDALTQGDFAGAIAHLDAVEIPMDGNNWERQKFLRMARMNLAYENEQYERFLTLAQDVLKDDPQSASLMIKIASGYSLLYEQRGDEALKQKAFDYIALARSAAGKSSDAPRGEIERAARSIERFLSPPRGSGKRKARPRPQPEEQGESLRIA